MTEVSEILMSVLSTIRVPRPGDRVHKDECAFSFASPVSRGMYSLHSHRPLSAWAMSGFVLGMFCFRPVVSTGTSAN